MYKDHTYEVIKQRMFDNMNLNIDKREGSFLNDMSSGIAMEQAKSHMRMDDIISLGFIRTGFNEYLEYRTSESGIYRKQGKKATGSVTIKYKDSAIGTVLSNGTVFLCGNFKYIMLNDITLGEESICYLESLYVGKMYNVLANSEFTLQNSIEGIESINNIEDFKCGIDVEDDESLRKRYDDYQDDPPTSGNAAHYRLWATEVDGVDRAIVYPRWDKSNGKDGNGTVKVMIIAKDNKPVTEDVLNQCRIHIEEEMPLSDITLTVTTPTLFDILIKANIKLKDGYDLSDIKYEFEQSLNEYLKFITTELTYSKVYGLIVNLIGVGDISSLTINDSNSNITISEDKIINISDIQLSEVV